ncbi:hypothetical protein BT69DRAFT_1305595 [Atractiella rhizophila]|nr:hypothetical protein BT69DRAFT_1305595 [Atractiella rhizophila]
MNASKALSSWATVSPNDRPEGIPRTSVEVSCRIQVALLDPTLQRYTSSQTLNARTMQKESVTQILKREYEYGLGNEVIEGLAEWESSDVGKSEAGVPKISVCRPGFLSGTNWTSSLVKQVGKDGLSEKRHEKPRIGEKNLNLNLSLASTLDDIFLPFVCLKEAGMKKEKSLFISLLDRVREFASMEFGGKRLDIVANRKAGDKSKSTAAQINYIRIRRPNDQCR